MNGTLGGSLTFPMIRKALSKKRRIPRKRKTLPRAVRPTPISVERRDAGSRRRREVTEGRMRRK